MAGYVIHLAVAQEYLKNNKNVEEDYNEFINGVIYPDSVKDKSQTHYGEKSCKTNLYKFLVDKKIDNSFNRGYFLHLLTDYLFYNKYIGDFTRDTLLNDYDILNKKLIDEYNIVLPNGIEKKVFLKEGTPQILSLEIIEKMIKDISNMPIDNVSNEIMENPEKWTKYREYVINYVKNS